MVDQATVAADPVADAQKLVQQYRDQLAADPNNVGLRNMLAWALCARLAPALAAAGRGGDAEAAAREGIMISRDLMADPASDIAGYAQRITEAAAYLPPAESVADTEVAVAALRGLVQADPTNWTKRNLLAWALCDRLAQRYRLTGQTDAAAGAAREGIEIAKVLIPDPATTDLIGEVRRVIEAAQFLPTDEQLACTQYGVDQYRQAAQAKPQDTQLRNYLAWALTDRLAPRLATANRGDDAAAAAQEGIEITRALATAPDADLEAYGQRIIAAAGYLQPTEGLADTEAAVALFRQALQSDPGSWAKKNVLAWALSDRLAVRRHQLGRPDAADAALEAIKLTETLAADPAATDLIGLATRVLEAATYLAADEQLDATVAGVDIYRRGVLANPQNHQWMNYLAWSLCDRLAPRLSQAGRRAEAEAAAREGIQLTHTLVADPGADLIGYGERVTEAATYLPAAEQVTETQAAVAWFRQAVAADPSWAKRNVLAWALSDRLALRLKAIDQNAAAAAAAREAIELTRVLMEDPAATDPAGHIARILAAALFLPTDEMLTATELAVTQARRIAHPVPMNEGYNKLLVRTFNTWADRLDGAARQPQAAKVRADAAKDLRFGEHALFGTDIRFPQNAPLAAISRNDHQLDVFGVGEDGAVYSQWWNSRWMDYFRVGTRNFTPMTPISAQTRNPDQMDVYAVGDDGGLWSAWWHDEWHDWFRIGDKTFPQLTPVTTVARGADYMEVWAVDENGLVNGVWWHGDWQPWYSLPGKVFPAKAPITALVRNPDRQEIWVVGTDGLVSGAWWDGTWHEWYTLPGKTFPPGTQITAVSRSSDYQEIWAVDENGEVWGQWWDGQWHDWYRLGDKTFPPGTPVTALSRDPDHMDIWAVGDDGIVYGAWWDGSWHPWGPAGSEQFPQRTPITAVSRQLAAPAFRIATMELFGVHADSGIHHATWFQDWKAFHRLPVVVARFSQDIVSGGLAALGGWAGVNITVDGSVQWYGHAHDSGADGYDFGVAYYVRIPNKTIALSHNGSVGGTATSGSRDHDWEEFYPNEVTTLSALSDFAEHGQDGMNMQYTSSIGQTLEGVVSLGVKWVVGAALGATIGAVIFVGVEIGSLVTTGSLKPGAAIVEDILWFAGPGNTLLAIGAAAISELGQRTRELTQEEYDWANDLVFRGSLPSRDTIVLTDTIGENGRALTLPRFDGKITVNMGDDGFDDPRRYQLDKGRVYGGTFIHELVHAWQIHHTGFDLALLANALAAAAQGHAAYKYGPAGGDYASDYTIEGQAQMIEEWYERHARSYDDKAKLIQELNGDDAVDDPYFRYVNENIRLGNY